MLHHYTDLIRKFDAVPIEKIASFFHDNADQIDTLIQLYQAYNKHILHAQSNRIQELKQAIISITADDAWSDMEGLELVYEDFSPAMMITGGFASGAGEALHTFNLFLTAPDQLSWSHYEDQIISRYTKHEPVIQGRRTILPIGTIPGHDTSAILHALEDAYTLLSELTVSNFLPTLTSH
ncbi:hypothetical protein [Chitinophaga agri]|uniref:Uncharacterized protein n=1 Tax=Chitinophaga agri TaxID=2703787 RepID=A0A6B9ZFC0_9BACT|nr:hypothetical protein [Chitinophaga agri]QHS61078.1 hypothetical protein GWR21_16165 [Chitinophaga agri]